MSAQGEDRSDFQAVLPPVSTDGKKLDFILFKATEGTSWVSQTYARNIAAAQAAGVPFGSYHFLHPSLDIQAQINSFMSVVSAHGGLEAGAMLAVDSEIASGVSDDLTLFGDRSDMLIRDPTGKAHVREEFVGDYPHHLLSRSTPAKLDQSTVDLATIRFITGVRSEVITRLGGDHCQELVYTYEAMLSQLGSCTDFPLWIADYSSSAPASVHPWDTWSIWQYAGGGGNGGSDQDGYNGDVAAFNTWRLAKTGPRPTPTPTPNWQEELTMSAPTVALNATGEIARTVQGLCVARGQNITVDGSFGPNTQAAVKLIQSAGRVAVDGVVGPKTWPVLLGL